MYKMGRYDTRNGTYPQLYFLVPDERPGSARRCVCVCVCVRARARARRCVCV